MSDHYCAALPSLGIYRATVTDRMLTYLIKPAAVAAALALLGWYVWNIDREELLATLAPIGMLAPLILLPYLLVYLVDCFAWAQTLKARPGFWTFFKIRWAGESVNNTVPSGHIGGEAVKVWLLRKQGVSTSNAATSVTVAKTAQTIAQAAFVSIAAGVFLLLVRDQPGVRTGLLLVLGGTFSAVVGLCFVQRVGIYKTFLGLSRVIRPLERWLEHGREKLLEFDRTLLHFYRHERLRFYRATVLYFCGWLIDTLEIYLVAYLLGMPIHWTQALVVEAFAGVAKIAGMWVPGSLGVQESGIVVLTRLVGAPESLGVAYALIRRLRDILFAALGWAFLLGYGNLRQIQANLSAARHRSVPEV